MCWLDGSMELSAVGELISWSQQNLPRTPVNFPRPLVDPTTSPQSQMNSTFLPGANCYASSVPSSSAESYWSSGANESAVDSKESPQQNFLPAHMRLEPINGSHDATAYGGPPNWSNGEWMCDVHTAADGCSSIQLRLDTERPGESQNQPPPGHGVKTETPGSLGFSQRPEADQNGSGVTPFFDVGDFRGPNFFGTPGNPNQSEGQPMYGEYSPLSVPQGQVSFHSVPAPEILALTPPGCEREIQSRSRDELVGFEGSRWVADESLECCLYILTSIPTSIFLLPEVVMVSTLVGGHLAVAQVVAVVLEAEVGVERPVAQNLRSTSYSGWRISSMSSPTPALVWRQNCVMNWAWRCRR